MATLNGRRIHNNVSMVIGEADKEKLPCRPVFLTKDRKFV